MLGFVRRVAMNINDFQKSTATSNKIYPLSPLQDRYLLQGKTTNYPYSPGLLLARIFGPMVYIYKCLVYKSDENISIKRRGRVTRMNDITNGILLEIPRSRTVAYKNSFYVRAPSVWNTLPKDLRDTTRSVSSFKTNLC